MENSLKIALNHAKFALEFYMNTDPAKGGPYCGQGDWQECSTAIEKIEKFLKDNENENNQEES